jgi:2-acylglycerol O-acyltransferase 2
MSLNPEPSQPEQRAEHNLAPKSYAAAAEEALQNAPEPTTEPNSHGSQTDGAVDDAKEALNNKLQDHSSANQTIGAKIIRIVPAEEYEGEGQDNSPKSPARHSHRRKSSLKSNGSVGHKHGEQLQHELFAKHKDGNGDTLTSVKPAAQFDSETRKDTKPKQRRSSELKSGRQAGEGWAKSKYVTYYLPARAHTEWRRLAVARGTPTLLELESTA